MKMFFLKRLIFKFMELGLGLKTFFALETTDPLFVNFKLSPEEADAVRECLPPGFMPQKVRFTDEDCVPEFWVSYNLYLIKYPKSELAHIRRARCEINTFVTDPKGRKGILVFSGSPLVSLDEKPSLVGRICEMAERMVIFIYGCGKLVPLKYELGRDKLEIAFEGFTLNQPLSDMTATIRLSDDYLAFNDISFFNEGKTFDLVNTNSRFTSARFHAIEGSALKDVRVKGPFFSRAPDKVYYHRGDIAYLVDALNR